jgi:hypothetical protein
LHSIEFDNLKIRMESVLLMSMPLLLAATS